jgi:hypothetical protein
MSLLLLLMLLKSHTRVDLDFTTTTSLPFRSCAARNNGEETNQTVASRKPHLNDYRVQHRQQKIVAGFVRGSSLRVQSVTTCQDHACERHLNLQQALRIGPCDRISRCTHNEVVALDASVQWHVTMHHAIGDEWGIHEEGVTFGNECVSKQLRSKHSHGGVAVR